MAAITITADKELIDRTVGALCLTGGYDPQSGVEPMQFARDTILRFFGEKIAAAAEIETRRLIEAQSVDLQKQLSAAHEAVTITFTE